MRVRFAVYTAVLYAGLVHNAFCVQEDPLTCVGEFRPGHLTGDCSLVVNRLRLSADSPWESMSGYGSNGLTPYRSQFGLPAAALSAVRRVTGATPERIAAVGSAVFGLASAALLAAFFASVASRIGPVAGHVGVLLTACCPPLLAFAPSLYWSLPATLAPFVFAWLAYPRVRLGVVLAGVAALVCVKGLCGYEYITTVIVAPVAAAVYHLAAVGDGVRRWMLPSVAVGVAGLVGFAGAMAIHAAQVSALTGGDGFATIRERATARTGVPTGDGVEKVVYPVFAPELPFLPERLRVPVRCFVNYFYQPALSSPQTWGRARFAVSLGWILAAAGVVLALFWRARERFPASAALAPAAAVGLLGAVNWQALAVNHMVFHGHLNLIVFCVPCVPLAFAGIGAGVAALGRARTVSIGLALFAVAVVGSNAVVLARRGEDATAADRVQAVLRGETAAVPLGVRGPEPLIGPLPIDPPYLPHWAAFSPMYAPSGEAAPLGAYGWLPLPRERTGRKPVTVVCVRGSEVVPARVGYFRLAAVERLHGKQVACVAFQAVIPAGTFAPGERPRLFAVPHDPGQPVVELTAGP